MQNQTGALWLLNIFFCTFGSCRNCFCCRTSVRASAGTLKTNASPGNIKLSVSPLCFSLTVDLYFFKWSLDVEERRGLAESGRRAGIKPSPSGCLSATASRHSRKNNNGLLSYSAGNRGGSCLVKLHSGFHFKGHRLKVGDHGAAVTRKGHLLRVWPYTGTSPLERLCWAPRLEGSWISVIKENTTVEVGLLLFYNYFSFYVED